MKNLLILTSILAAQFLTAQTERGTFLLGGNIAYSQGKNANDNASLPNTGSSTKTRNLNANVRFGYFFANNFAAGLLVGNNYNYSHYETPYADQNSSTQTINTMNTSSSLGLFARGYKLFDNNRFGFFCEFSGAYLAGSQKTTYKYAVFPDQTSHADITGFNVGLRPGFTFFITKKIGLEVLVGNLLFSNQKTTSYSGGAKSTISTSNNFNFNLTPSSLSLGAAFYLGGKKN